MNCQKRQFNSKKEAKSYFKNLSMTSNRGKRNYYVCENCNKWHMTSITKAKRKSCKKILNKIGIHAGQIWADKNGHTLEIIKPPKILTGLGLWQHNFTLVSDSKRD